MKTRRVGGHGTAASLPREEQLAWRLDMVAADPVPVVDEVAARIGHAVIDLAATAAAALNRQPVVRARTQAMAHPYAPGATVFGHSLAPWGRVSPDWAAWTNGIAVAMEDSPSAGFRAIIPPILAVTQHRGLTGADLLRGLAAGYEVQASLAAAFAIDPVACTGPAAAAGIGAALGLSVGIIHRAVGSALVAAPPKAGLAGLSAGAGKIAVEAVDRAMLGEGTDEPVYEVEDGLFAQLAADPGGTYHALMPEAGETKLALLGRHPALGTLGEAIARFRALAEGIVSRPEQERLVALVARLPGLSAEELFGLSFVVDPAALSVSPSPGLFRGRDALKEHNNIRMSLYFS